MDKCFDSCPKIRELIDKATVENFDAVVATAGLITKYCIEGPREIGSKITEPPKIECPPSVDSKNSVMKAIRPYLAARRRIGPQLWE